MKLEQQVVSLELAKRLKELGVKQESLFYYERDKYQMTWDGVLKDFFPQIRMVGEALDTQEGDYYSHDKNSISAYTVAELGEMLPPRLELGDIEHPAHRLAFEKQETRWHGTYLCAVCKGKLFSEYAETEADARAGMLIYLLENKLITI